MEYMGIIGFVFGIFGFLAYLNQGGLKKRITDLERQLTKMQGTSYADDRKALIKLAKECVGQPVKSHIYTCNAHFFTRFIAHSDNI